MATPLRTQRPETAPFNPNTRQAKGTMQWFLEKEAIAGKAITDTHPITFNNQIKLLVCGEEGFSHIAGAMSAAKNSIDIICWGFDPGMELIRQGSTWPRGETYGDLLSRKAQQGVKVRLLIWHDSVGSAVQKNMPGYSNQTDHLIDPSGAIPHAFAAKGKPPGVALRPASASEQRQQYCAAWYAAAMGKRIPNLEIRLRTGCSQAHVEAALTTGAPEDPRNERFAPDVVERQLLAYVATHHQKPILIDYDGDAPIAYVMGLNSLTDYWDSDKHEIDDPRREAIEANDKDGRKAGCRYKRPYRDYACSVQGGALIWLNKNFCEAWDRAGLPAFTTLRPVPAACKRAAARNDVAAQIVRTHPQDKDKTIKQLYYQSVTHAQRYIYIENQYFHYEEFAQHLKEVRQNSLDLSSYCGQPTKLVPVVHVILVIPKPEESGMVPRTHDTMATLGQQQTFLDQTKEIEQRNKIAANGIDLNPYRNFFDRMFGVVTHANSIKVPSIRELETIYGLKILPLMLATSGMVKHAKTGNYAMRYRNIYIHSKLMLIDDGFFTLGSANINQRSMAVDTELNIASNSVSETRALRQRIWNNLSGGKYDGGGGTENEIAQTFVDWAALAKENADKRSRGQDMLEGFLIPLQDDRVVLYRVA